VYLRIHKKYIVLTTRCSSRLQKAFYSLRYYSCRMSLAAVKCWITRITMEITGSNPKYWLEIKNWRSEICFEVSTPWFCSDKSSTFLWPLTNCTRHILENFRCADTCQELINRAAVARRWHTNSIPLYVLVNALGQSERQAMEEGGK
jgi:hypothetical protein